MLNYIVLSHRLESNALCLICAHAACVQDAHEHDQFWGASRQATPHRDMVAQIEAPAPPLNFCHKRVTLYDGDCPRRTPKLQAPQLYSNHAAGPTRLILKACLRGVSSYLQSTNMLLPNEPPRMLALEPTCVAPSATPDPRAHTNTNAHAHHHPMPHHAASSPHSHAPTRMPSTIVYHALVIDMHRPSRTHRPQAKVQKIAHTRPDLLG